MDWGAIEHAFDDAVAQAVFPGAVVLVGKGGEVIYQQAFGHRSLVPDKTALHASTVFDVASLTKPLATTMAIMHLVRDKKLRLEDQVTRFIPTYGVFGKHMTTCRHLLNHSSGLPAWKPYYEEIIKLEKMGKIHFVASRAAHRFVLEQIHREKPLDPPGRRALYSDLGFMLLGEIVETVSGATLDRFCRERVFKPLGLRSTAFVDLTQLKARHLEPVEDIIAPTENCPWRKKILCGEVHDDNAYAMGGVAGHAGLFSSAQDIHAVIAFLNRCLRGQDDLLPAALVTQFLTKDESVANPSHALGWDTPSPKDSASGQCFSPCSVGHLGFTGTSIWWDLEKNCHVILLTNRVHPSRKNEKIKEFRPKIHDLIMKALFP